MDRNVLNFDLFVLNCCFFLADYDQLEFSISSRLVVYYDDYIMSQ